jgi:TatD DNase family protein
MCYIDIHTHKTYSEPDLITVQNLFPGEDCKTYQKNHYYSAGLHPWYIQTAEVNNRMLLQVEQAVQQDQVIFVGECGLDRICGTDQQEQKRVFEKQIELAVRVQKPLLIHCVKTCNEMLEFRKKNLTENPWILHGFRGPVQLAMQLEKFGFLFSFGKALLEKNKKTEEAFRRLPLNKIFLETDAFSGAIREIYKKASEIRNIDIVLLAESLRENFNRLIASECIGYKERNH